MYVYHPQLRMLLFQYRVKSLLTEQMQTWTRQAGREWGPQFTKNAYWVHGSNTYYKYEKF